MVAALVALGALVAVASALMRIKRLDAEREAAMVAQHQAETEVVRLRYAGLPDEVAKRLVNDADGLAAERHAEVAVVCADVPGFDRATKNLTPEAVVDLLQRMFQRFDALAEKHGSFTVPAFGDTWVAVVIGADAAPRAADLAFAMQNSIADPKFTMNVLGIRVGIHLGPAVTGVMNREPRQFNVWGESVDIARRVLERGDTATVLVSAAVAQRLEGAYQLLPRGEVDLGGGKPVGVSFLVKRL